MPSLVYRLQETAQLWKASPSAPDLGLTLTSLANQTLRQGARWDRWAGAGSAVALPELYSWRAWIKVATTPTIGQLVTLYLATSDGTHTDGDLGTADATINIERRRNATPIGAIEIDEASTTREFSNSGLILIEPRYVIPLVLNESGVALSSTATDHGFVLRPFSLQIQ